MLPLEEGTSSVHIDVMPTAGSVAISKIHLLVVHIQLFPSKRSSVHQQYTTDRELRLGTNRITNPTTHWKLPSGDHADP